MSVALAVLVASAAVYPVPRAEIAIHQASELVAPCREEAQAHFLGQGRATSQWSASHKSRGNDLFVEGRLRIHGGGDVEVRCLLPRGARLGHMRMEIEEQ